LEFFATNAPDPPHWTLNSSIGLFRTVWVHFGFVSLLHETRSKTGWIGAINEEVRATKSHESFSQRTHLIQLIGRWTHELVRFVVFGCILYLFRCCTKLGAKRVELVQLMKKFVARNRIKNFRNEHTRSTPLDPKLMYWCDCSVWLHLSTFR